MFQLIVAVISIALVAALAIASIFYGGDAFVRSSDKANVTALVNQGQQIAGGIALYRTDTGLDTTTVQTLVTADYLTAEPTPSKIADGAWEIDDVNGVAAVTLKAGNDVDSKICHEVYRQAGGIDADADGDIAVTEKAANPQFDCVVDGTDTNFTFKL